MFEVSRVEGVKLIALGAFSTMQNAEEFCGLLQNSHFVISEVDENGSYICDIVKEVTPQN